jgi:GDP-D-mannose dehydratase
MTKVALITGITGQDGSFLAELLVEKDMKYTAYYAVPPHSIRHVLSICISTSG